MCYMGGTLIVVYVFFKEIENEKTVFHILVFLIGGIILTLDGIYILIGFYNCLSMGIYTFILGTTPWYLGLLVYFYDIVLRLTSFRI